MSRALYRGVLIALAVYVVVLLVVLLNPSSAAPSELVQRVSSLATQLGLPAEVFGPARVEFGLNVLAFVPLSFLGSVLRPKVSLSTWTAAGFAGSLLVEVVQTLLPDRTATHSDVVANTLGMALGATAAWVARRAVARPAAADQPQKQARISPTG